MPAEGSVRVLSWPAKREALMFSLYMYARARVMGSYSESEKASQHRQRRRCASAIRARPAFVLGPVDIPP
jgi:hypothetical protein